MTSPNTAGTTCARDQRFDGFGGKGFDLSGRMGVKTLSPGDLDVINSYALKPLEADAIAVYESKVANNQVDRDGERFHEEVLQDLAHTLPGKSLLIGHNWGPPGIGRFFKASTVEQDGVMWLMASFYLLKVGNETLIQNIDAGIVWAMSIGFFCPDLMMITGHDGELMFAEYRRGPNGEKAEAIEASLVFLGSQFDSSVVKGKAHELAQKARERKGRGEPPAAKAGFWHALKTLIEETFLAEHEHEEVAGGPAPAAPAPTQVKEVKDSGAAPEQTTRQEDEMDVKAIEELQGVLKGMQEGLAAMTGAIGEVKTVVAETSEQVKTFGTRMETVEKFATEMEDAGAKMLDRIEAIESVLAAPKAGGGDEPAPEPEGEGKAVKSAKAVFGDTIIPMEYRARR